MFERHQSFVGLQGASIQFRRWSMRFPSKSVWPIAYSWFLRMKLCTLKVIYVAFLLVAVPVLAFLSFGRGLVVLIKCPRSGPPFGRPTPINQPHSSAPREVVLEASPVVFIFQTANRSIERKLLHPTRQYEFDAVPARMWTS